MSVTRTIKRNRIFLKQGINIDLDLSIDLAYDSVRNINGRESSMIFILFTEKFLHFIEIFSVISIITTFIKHYTKSENTWIFHSLQLRYLRVDEKKNLRRHCCF